MPDGVGVKKATTATNVKIHVIVILFSLITHATLKENVIVGEDT